MNKKYLDYLYASLYSCKYTLDNLEQTTTFDSETTRGKHDEAMRWCKGKISDTEDSIEKYVKLHQSPIYPTQG